MKLALEFVKWTTNYAVYKWSGGGKVGKVYFPRNQLVAEEVQRQTHILIHSEKPKESANES